jgi:hypothetical protein
VTPKPAIRIGSPILVARSALTSGIGGVGPAVDSVSIAMSACGCPSLCTAWIQVPLSSLALVPKYAHIVEARQCFAVTTVFGDTSVPVQPPPPRSRYTVAGSPLSTVPLTIGDEVEASCVTSVHPTANRPMAMALIMAVAFASAVPRIDAQLAQSRR